MRVYRNDMYQNRGFTWQPPEQEEQFDSYENDSIDDNEVFSASASAPIDESFSPYPSKKRPCPPPCPPCPPPYPPVPPCPPHPRPCPPCPPRPRPCPPPHPPFPPCPPPYPPCPPPYPPYPPCPPPYPKPCPPPCFKYPLPQPIPYPYPVPCPIPSPKPEPKPIHEEQAFGYFASNTAGGAFAGGVIPFNFTDPLNHNVNLTGNQVSAEVEGIYRIVYSVTTVSAAPGIFLQLALNSLAVSQSAILIVSGLNTNEIFLRLRKQDNLTLNLTGAVTLVSGKNASLLLELVEKEK